MGNFEDCIDQRAVPLGVSFKGEDSGFGFGLEAHGEKNCNQSLAYTSNLFAGGSLQFFFCCFFVINGIYSGLGN